MKIALLGYGRMGKTIDKLATAAGHEVVLRSSNLAADLEQLKEAEVAIEFSQPEAALKNIELCLESGVAVVCGTTGWLDKEARGTAAFGPVKDWVEKYEGAFFYASNFSLGVNLFFHLNVYLAKLMANLPDYAVGLEEIHHIHKLDAPSGTAITLADGIIENTAKLEDWELKAEIWPEKDIHSTQDLATSLAKNSLPITAYRLGETPGTHRITYESSADTLKIEHEAHGRIGFAKGALAAAEWLKEKQGIFGMDDLLGFAAAK